jgi:hypothetical protein
MTTRVTVSTGSHACAFIWIRVLTLTKNKREAGAGRDAVSQSGRRIQNDKLERNWHGAIWSVRHIDNVVKWHRKGKELGKTYQCNIPKLYQH